jgi:hypothetical protein
LRLSRSRAIQATITNIGARPVTLVMPNDGSYDGWRTPFVGWSVLRAWDSSSQHAPPPTEPQFRICGIFTPLRPNDMFTLAPGQKKIVDRAPALSRPGRYRIVFHYLNNPNRVLHPAKDRRSQVQFLITHPQSWLRIGPSEIAGLMRPAAVSTLEKRAGQSLPCSLVSNELTVDVLP